MFIDKINTCSLIIDSKYENAFYYNFKASAMEKNEAKKVWKVEWKKIEHKLGSIEERKVYTGTVWASQS